jgi:hypothetical protein
MLATATIVTIIADVPKLDHKQKSAHVGAGVGYLQYGCGDEFEFLSLLLKKYEERIKNAL